MRVVIAVFVISIAGVLAFVVSQRDGEIPDVGQVAFKNCVACHVVRNPEGMVLAGRGGRTGPNLFGIVGKPAANASDFRYKRSLLAARDGGLIWTVDKLEDYLLNPTEFLRKELNDPKARSAMSFRVRRPEEARILAEFLASFP